MKKGNSHIINLICLVMIVGFVKITQAQDPLPNPFETLQVMSLQGAIITSPTDEGIIEKGTMKVFFSPNSTSNGINPIDEDVEIVCIDGKQEIHISLPAGVFEVSKEGRFDIIDPNDPQGMGIKIFLTDEFGTIIESYDNFLTYFNASIKIEVSSNSSPFSVKVEIQEEEGSSPLASCDPATLALGNANHAWEFIFGDDFGSIGDVKNEFTKANFEIIAGI